MSGLGELALDQPPVRAAARNSRSWLPASTTRPWSGTTCYRPRQVRRGSNADVLSSDLATHLTGRYVELPVWPLGFAELAAFWSQRLAVTVDTVLEEYLGHLGAAFLLHPVPRWNVKANHLYQVRDSSWP